MSKRKLKIHFKRQFLRPKILSSLQYNFKPFGKWSTKGCLNLTFQIRVWSKKWFSSTWPTFYKFTLINLDFESLLWCVLNMPFNLWKENSLEIKTFWFLGPNISIFAGCVCAFARVFKIFEVCWSYHVKGITVKAA